MCGFWPINASIDSPAPECVSRQASVTV